MSLSTPSPPPFSWTSNNCPIATETIFQELLAIELPNVLVDLITSQFPRYPVHPCSHEILHFVCNSKPLNPSKNYNRQYPLQISGPARDRTGKWVESGYLDQHRKVYREWWELQKIYDGKYPSFPFLRSLQWYPLLRPEDNVGLGISTEWYCLLI